MKCNLCNEEYEFSLGHRCPVMQEESKPRMTQPDLVSKLREAVETIRSLASHIPHSRAELPGNPSTWCDRCKFDAALVVLADPSASPSTPIVPGTAGLSAGQVQAADGLNAVLGAAPPAERWTCPDCGYDSMPYPPKDYHICPKCMVEFGNDDRKSTLIEREARIRKDVLEEAAQHFDRHENGCPVLVNGMLCTCKDRWPWIGEAIRALAERPAPAGEVRISRWQCPHCAHVNSMISANCENCKIPLVNTAR